MSFLSGLILTPLLDAAKAQGQKALGEILHSVFPGSGSIRDQATAYLHKRLDAQEGRTAGKQLAHAVLKQVENSENPAMPGDVEQRIAVAQALATNAALQYAHCGELLLQLQAAQAALERARGTDGEAAAREAREAAEQAFTTANINIGRVAAGSAAQ